ncbi:MAG: PAS domain S-box protein [Acidobacteriia bacterium]|nr:PAS domain S-box protein [Terriglobia bacterium]
MPPSGFRRRLRRPLAATGLVAVAAAMRESLVRNRVAQAPRPDGRRPGAPAWCVSTLQTLAVILAASASPGLVSPLGAATQPTPGVATASRVALPGTWHVKVGDGADWAASQFDDTAWRTVVLPGSWEEHGLKGFEGPVWYRRVVDLKEPLTGSASEGWGLLVGRTRFGTVDLWINGVLVGSVGGPRLPLPVPALRVLAVPKTAVEGHDRLAIAIRVTRVAWASDRTAIGGPVGRDLALAPFRSLVDQVALDRHRELFDSLPMLIGSLAFLGVALAFSYLWMRWRFGLEHLWFGLVAFGFAANTFLNSPWVFEVTERFPLVIRLTEISGVLLPAVFIQFLWSFLSRPFPALLRVYQGSFGFLALAIALSPGLGWVIDTQGLRWFWLVPLLGCGLYAVVAEVRRGNKAARSVVLAGVLLAGTELVAVVGNFLHWVPPFALEPAWAFGVFVLALGLVLLDRLNWMRVELHDQVESLALAKQALRESEQRYRQLVELCPDAIVVHSEGRLVLANSAALKVLGADDSAEWLGRPIADFVHPDFRPVVAERVRTMVEEGAQMPLIAERFLRLDGSPIDVEVAAGPLTFQGRPAVQVVFRDVTERKRAEESLRESELHFRTLAETTGVGIFIVQNDRFTYANPEAERLIGYSIHELHCMNFWEIVHPDHRELVRQRAHARLDGAPDLPGRYEVKGITRGGEERWFSLTSGRTLLSGRPALVATIADITEERRLREVQSALYQISEATQAAGNLDELFSSIHRIVGRLMNAKNFYIALHDPTTGLISFPYFVDEVDPTPEPFPVGRGMTGYVLRSGQPLLATPEVLQDLEARGEIEPLGAPSIDWLGVPLKAQDAIIGVLAVQSYAGTVRYIEADKEVLGYISAQVAQAIARKQAEEAVRESQKMRLVGQLAGGVAHDFNNLLQALLGSVDVLRTRASDPNLFSRALAGIEEDIRRAAALTRQLLLFSRREVVKVEPLDLNEVVRQASTLLRRLLRENILVVLELAEASLRVEADRGQMEQVLVNLAVNASDAMAEGGRLTIRSGQADDEAVFLEIEDTGSGMSDEVQAHIFEPFFTTKGKEKGVGLGLSVVHGIVTQHGGRVEVRSQPGSGSIFRIVLPGVVSAPGASAAKLGRERPESFPGRGERILLVEDEEGSRQAVDDILRLLGYSVVTVASGEEAAALPTNTPFDLLLTDMLLPGVHGSELAARLRERWPSLKVILMSGYAEDESVRRLVSDGVVRFLQKPFGMEVLATEIRAALGGA